MKCALIGLMLLFFVTGGMAASISGDLSVTSNVLVDQGSFHSLGGYVTATTTSGASVDNKTLLFQRGGDGAVWYNKEGSWTSLGGYIQGDPTVSQTGDVVKIAVRGGDNGLWICTLQPDGTSSWAPQGGYLTSSPAMDAGYVAVRGGDSCLWIKDLSTGTWNGLGGYLNPTSPISTLLAPSSGLWSFVTGGDQNLWANRFNPITKSSTWTNIAPQELVGTDPKTLQPIFQTIHMGGGVSSPVSKKSTVNNDNWISVSYVTPDKSSLELETINSDRLANQGNLEYRSEKVPIPGGADETYNTPVSWYGPKGGNQENTMVLGSAHNPMILTKENPNDAAYWHTPGGYFTSNPTYLYNGITGRGGDNAQWVKTPLYSTTSQSASLGLSSDTEIREWYHFNPQDYFGNFFDFGSTDPAQNRWYGNYYNDKDVIAAMPPFNPQNYYQWQNRVNWGWGYISFFPLLY